MTGFVLGASLGLLLGLGLGFACRRREAREWQALYEATREELDAERDRTEQLAREVNAANAEARASRRLQDGGHP